MITPRFQIEQSDTDLVFTIHAPYCSISDAEIYSDLDLFCFYASPYYLRLHLPGHIEETDSSTASYDADNGVFRICVQKATKGEYFPNLDFITSLLTPSSKKSDVNRPKVEVIGDDGDDDIDADDEWYIDQSPFEEPSGEFLLGSPKYGFANLTSGALLNFTTEFADVLDVPYPDKTPLNDRSKLRYENENSVFSEDHYLADWAQPEEIDPILNFKPPWQECTEVKLSDKDLDIMKDFPKKEFLLDSKEEHIVLFSLVDILFAFSYEIRTTFGEKTVESAWTVNKLSATLSWLQSFSSLRNAVTVSVRRSLCFPLFRHWDLSMKVLNDVKDILKLGKRQVLKCLLEIYSLFNCSEPRYILNQLYIRDYCVWIQQVPDNRIKAISNSLNEVTLQKSDIELELDELECAALIVQQEESSSIAVSKTSQKAANHCVDGQLAGDLKSLKLQDDCHDSGSSSGTSDDESDSSSSSSDLDSDDLSEEE